MRVLPFFIAPFFLATAVSAASFTEAERAQLLEHLKRSEIVMRDAIRGLSPAQANFKSAPDRWSVLECAEHLTQAEMLLLDDAMRGLKNPPTDRPHVSDERVLEDWGTRKTKAQSSGPYDPAKRWPDVDAVWKEFEKRRAKTKAFVAETKDDLRAHMCCGGMDVYQQLLGISAHTLRHVEQMNEVKADPKYPKN